MGDLNTTSEPTFNLVPAQLDFTTTKTQWLFGSLAALAAAFTAGLLTFRSGVIGTDGSVLYAVAHNAPSGIAGVLKATATPEFTALSYGPFATLSLFVDYAFWHAHTTPYHVVNTILYGFCVVLVAAITSHITSRFGNRLAGAAATWAALLFALFPGHPDALAAISGRVDILATLLCLTSVYCYIRFRLIREGAYLSIALVSFILGLLTNAQALFVPAVITAAELLLLDSEPGNSQRFAFPMFFWMALVFCGTISLVWPWAIPVQHASTLLPAWLAAIGSPNTWSVLLFSTHEIPASLKVVEIVGYGGAAIMMAARLCIGAASWRVLLWLISWVLFSIAPEAASANVDGRLMLLPSAALAILLSVSCIPSIDIAGKRLSLRFALAGTAVCVVLCTTFMSVTNRQQNYWNTQGIRHLGESPAQALPRAINVRH